MDPITLGVISLIVSVSAASVNEANRHADIREKKIQFTQRVTEELMEKGVNAAVICSPHRVRGYTLHRTQQFEGKEYHIYTAPRNTVMAIENLGDGGFENWCNRGMNWVRWGQVVHFHDHWNSRMGKPYEHRSARDYPHRDWLNGGQRR